MTKVDKAKKAVKQVAKEAGLTAKGVQNIGDAFGDAIREIADGMRELGTAAEQGKKAATAAAHEISAIASDIDDHSALYYFYKELADWAQTEADMAELDW